MRLFFLIFLLFTSCATRYDIPRDYWSEVHQSPRRDTKRTVVFFLVDGLSFQALIPQLEKNRLPHLKAHFLNRGQTIHKAHSIFPSLTFPNLSSLLHEAPVHVTGALGNKVIFEGRMIDLDDVSDRSEFGRLMQGNNVFTRLTEKGQRSVSLDYGLGVDATFHSEVLDIKAGLAFANRDYIYLDQKKIESLSLLLSQVKSENWPDFIFVHLIGVDFLSHLYGPSSHQVSDYLVSLDKSLKLVFKQLRDSERLGHETVSILTADHGFSRKLTRTVNIEKLIKSVDSNLRVVNEVRFASVYNNKQPSQHEQERWTENLIKSGQVEIVSYRHGSQVRIRSKSLDLRFSYQQNLQCPGVSMGISFGDGVSICPSQLEKPFKDLFYPYLVENLAFFFQSEKHPDLLVIPGPTTGFALVKGGYHGGPTPEEILVPLLMRNANLIESSRTPSLSELLRFL